MIKFILVEDNKDVQKKVKEILRKISIQTDQNIEIEYYEKYDKKLAAEISNTLFRKVYIMDIELENSISGLDIANKIREDDWDSEIIFITTHDRMFEEVHRNILEVFDFIEKFHNFESRLEKDILKIINKKYDKKILKLGAKNTELEIYMKEILYITSEDRKTIIHTAENIFKTNYTLEKLKELLDERFVQTNKSCLANKERMMERNYSQGYFILDTGEKVDMLSKKFRKEIEKE